MYPYIPRDSIASPMLSPRDQGRTAKRKKCFLFPITELSFPLVQSILYCEDSFIHLYNLLISVRDLTLFLHLTFIKQCTYGIRLGFAYWAACFHPLFIAPLLVSMDPRLKSVPREERARFMAWIDRDWNFNGLIESIKRGIWCAPSPPWGISRIQISQRKLSRRFVKLISNNVLKVTTVLTFYDCLVLNFQAGHYKKKR